MSCDIEALKQVPFFGLLDDEELTVLASQVEQKTFGARQRIYKIARPRFAPTSLFRALSA